MPGGRMTFATPMLAIIAAAIAVPALVILYFLKLRRRSVEISSTLLWKKAIQDLQANAPFQRLRKNILLLLQLLALAAALLAVAQPEKKTAETTGTRHVLLIDRSASMAARDGNGGLSRLDAAKKDAVKLIDSLDEGDIFGADAHEAMVIAFDTTARVVQGFTSDKARLREAVESIEQTDAPGSIREAFQLARAHRPRPAGEPSGDPEPDADVFAGIVPPQTFHLFTDGRLADLDSFSPTSRDSVIYHTAGDPKTTNIGIVGLRAERGYEQPEHVTVFVGVQNTAPEPRSVEVELLIDGVPSAVRDVSIPGAETREGVVESGGENGVRAELRPEPGRGGLVFEMDMSRGAIATVRVHTDDAFATDDEGVLVIPPATKTSVAVVTSGNLYLAEALAGLPLATLDTLTPEEFKAALEDGRADRYDVVVLDGILPPNTSPGRALGPGRWLILGAVPGGSEGLIDRGEAGMTRFVDWKRNHPVLRDLTLEPVRIGVGRRIEIGENSVAVPLAETTAGPGIVEMLTPESRAIAVLFDVAESNWPFDVSFVVFLASAIDYLDTVSGAEGGARSVRPGEVISTRLPARASAVRLVSPDGDSHALTTTPDGRVTWGPVRRAGLYTLRWRGDTGPLDVSDGGEAVRPIASNLLDAFESDIAPESEVALASRIVSSSSRESMGVRRYWRWLLLGSLLVMMLEWYVYNRKVRL